MFRSEAKLDRDWADQRILTYHYLLGKTERFASPSQATYSVTEEQFLSDIEYLKK